MRVAPDRSLERAWQANGFRLIAGVDEVGRGPLAGPVVAGAVILPADDCRDWLADLRDSKLLRPCCRSRLAGRIRAEAASCGIGVVGPACIDAIGIASASRKAMQLAVQQLAPQPNALLLDAFRLPEVDLPQQAIVHGDALCSAIAAASIIAKVARDQMLVDLDSVYPGYGLARHRGYATAAHLAALRQHGPSPIHRYSFRPVREAGEP